MAYPDVQQTEFNRATENLIEITWTYVNLQKEFPKLSETDSIKTLKGWEESGKNWDDFCKPGELVDEDVYWYFLNILPPRNMGAGYLQVGEPYDSRLNPKTGKYMATYSTFVKVGDKVWKYCGNCFPGESADIESEDKR